MKRATRSTKCAGINAGNHLEQDQIFSFLTLGNIIDFEKPYESTKDISKTFRYHPKCIEGRPNLDELKKLPQQWIPFIDTIQFQDLRSNPTTRMNKYGITYGEIKKAMLDYLGRLTGIIEPKFVDWHNMQEIELSERVWSDSMVYASPAYKENNSDDFKRDGFCYFTIKQSNNQRSVINKWYVGRIVLFMNFSFLDDDDGSTYALVEPMVVNGVSSFDGTITRVKAYATDARKYALVDVGDLDGSVGLLTDVDCTLAEKESRRRVEAGNEKSFKYVIRPGRAFPRLLSSACAL